MSTSIPPQLVPTIGMLIGDAYAHALVCTMISMISGFSCYRTLMPLIEISPPLQLLMPTQLLLLPIQIPILVLVCP